MGFPPKKLQQVIQVFTTAVRWAAVVIESKILIDCLIALPTFSYSPIRAPRDIVVKDDEQEEVKRVLKAILELGSVMSHSGFGATLDPLRKFDPPPKFFFRHCKFFLLIDLLGFP